MTILKECLGYLSRREDLDVIALVHSRELCGFPGIRYIEIPWSIRSWVHRLWCEYVTMNRISRTLPPVDLWFSLHDTTPRVKARRQAVYCHTSFPFMSVTAKDWWYNPRIPAFAILLGGIFRINVRRNAYVVVQQQWFREMYARLTGYDLRRIIVAPPRTEGIENRDLRAAGSETCFFYPSGPDCHKNLETLCEAAVLLERRLGADRFRVILTVGGDENRYARALKKKYGSVSSIVFAGYMTKQQLNHHYQSASSLVFLSRIESWGLPISEFRSTGRPMILADLPYAHDTAAGCPEVSFVPVTDPKAVAASMEGVISGDMTAFRPVPELHIARPFAPDWESLFNTLLSDEDTPDR